MKKSLISIFAVFGLLISTGANAAWFEQSHSISNLFFMDVEALSETNAIAVGDGGIILYTLDGGDTWLEATESTDAFLYSLDQYDGINIFAVGSDGTLLKSEDSGVTWNSQGSPIIKDFFAVDTYNGTRLTAVGEDGSIAVSNNAGLQWSQISYSSSEDLLGVAYLNSTTIFAVGENGKMIKSIDSGVTWSNRNSTSSEDLHDIVFLSITFGLVVGNNGTVLKTTDAGMTWEDMDVQGLTSENMLAIDAIDENNILIAGDQKAFITHDGGVTWSEETFVDDAGFFFGVSYVTDDIHFGSGTNLTSSSSIFKFDSAVEEQEEVVEEEEEEIIEESGLPAAGSLISLTCSEGADTNDPCKAVYYVGEDGKRHAFPNDRVYFTWYDNFDDVVDVDADTLASFSLGSNVTYKPGVKMVKFVTVNTVYVVEQGGILRGIDSEDVASALYGEDWNQQIDDISDAFIGNYSFGDDILSADDYDPAAAENSVTNIDDNL